MENSFIMLSQISFYNALNETSQPSLKSVGFVGLMELEEIWKSNACCPRIPKILLDNMLVPLALEKRGLAVRTFLETKVS